MITPTTINISGNPTGNNILTSRRFPETHTAKTIANQTNALPRRTVSGKLNAYKLSICRAITSRWISLVPSPIVINRVSR